MKITKEASKPPARNWVTGQLLEVQVEQVVVVVGGGGGGEQEVGDQAAHKVGVHVPDLKVERNGKNCKTKKLQTTSHLWLSTLASCNTNEGFHLKLKLINPFHPNFRQVTLM